MKKKQCSTLLFFILLQLYAVAQKTGFHFQAIIYNVKADGFYTIVLTPSINAHLKTDFSDLRIINDSGRWVPHLLRKPETEYANESVINKLKIVKKENSTIATDLIVQSTELTTSNLLLEIKNTAAERSCTLTGSDDLKLWYTINDSILIRPITNTTEANSNFSIKFPPCNYKYLKIYISNNRKAPFQIISAATETIDTTFKATKKILSNYPSIANPVCMISQKDSGSLSYIKVVQTAPFHFEKISLKISGVKYYSRKVDLYLPVSATHSFLNPGQLFQSFTISNNSTLQYKLPICNATTFYLIIHNEDNLPIIVEQVKTYSNYREISAWLEKGNAYNLIMDNSEATTPNYDLKEQVNLHERFPMAETGPIKSLGPTVVITVAANTNKWKIWLSIGIAAIVLFFFTYKLVREIN